MPRQARRWKDATHGAAAVMPRVASRPGRARTADVAPLLEEDADVGFSDLMLSERVLRGLQAAGFERPSPIQVRSTTSGKSICHRTAVPSPSGTGLPAAGDPCWAVRHGRDCTGQVRHRQDLCLRSNRPRGAVSRPARAAGTDQPVHARNPANATATFLPSRMGRPGRR